MARFRFALRMTVAERLAPFNLRPDTIAAASQMASDQRTDRHIVAMETVLSHAEHVLRMMDARYERVMGLLVLTSERILFYPRKGQDCSFSVSLTDVSSLEAGTRKVMGTVHIRTEDAQYTVDQILGTQGEMLVADADRVRRGWSETTSRDPVQLLTELRALRDAGVIDAAEFEVRKAELWKDI